jgi:hypothetical protein
MDALADAPKQQGQLGIAAQTAMVNHPLLRKRKACAVCTTHVAVGMI